MFLDVQVTLTINNTEQIGEALQNKEIDLGIVEGQSKKSGVKYNAFAKDEIVLVSNIKNPLAAKHSITNDHFLKGPPGMSFASSKGNDHGGSSRGNRRAETGKEVFGQEHHRQRTYFFTGRCFLFVAAYLAMLMGTYSPAVLRLSHYPVAFDKSTLTLTLFLIGCGLSRKLLLSVGFKPLIQGIVLWLFISVTSLWMICMLFS